MPKLPAIFAVSDLHIDTGPFEWSEAALAADLIIVAGDLANGVFDIDFLTKPGRPLVFVPGNHDFWSKDGATDGSTDMFEMYADMKRAAAGTNVHVLWDEAIELCGVRILGTPLWTDFGGGNEQLMAASFAHSRDYVYINARSWYSDPENLKLHLNSKRKFQLRDKPDAAESGAFTPTVAYALHRKSVAFIESKLDETFDGPTILVTHMAPTYESLRKSGSVREYTLDPRSWQCRGRDNTGLARVAGYASDLTHIFTKYRAQLDLAVHGHIHSSLDFVCGSTRVVANPRGRYSGPLTKENSEHFGLFGYPVTAEQIARSQATFAEYPYWGDNWDFEPQKLFRLEDGLAPALQPLVDEALPQLTDLQAEVLELAPYIAHATPAIRRSVQEAAISRTEKFAVLLEEVLAPAAQAFDARESHNGWWGHLDAMRLPKPKHALVPRFEDAFERDVDPAVELAHALDTIAQLLSIIPMVPMVPRLAGAMYAERMERVFAHVRSKGLTPELTNPAPTGHWRKLYSELGTLELGGIEDDQDEDLGDIETEVDTIINGGPPPRHVFMSVRGKGGIRLPVPKLASRPKEAW